MTDWKNVIIGGLISSVLTLVFSLVLFPLFFLGPVIGGLVTVYLSRGDQKDGAVDGALSGIIGGLIVGLLFILGFGVISAAIGLIFTNIGIVAGTISILFGITVTIFSIVIFAVLGAVGGVIGFEVREK